MKKLLFGLIATVMLGFVGNAQDINQLGKDADFIKFIKNEYNFVVKANDEKLIISINKDNTLKEDELSIFYQVFTTNKNDYSAFVTSQSVILNSLERKYNTKNYTQQELNAILVPHIEDILTSVVTVAEKRNCRGVYIATLALNASVAYGAHVGCLGADITVVGGILCHGAVAVGQSAANYIAYQDYLDCKG